MYLNNIVRRKDEKFKSLVNYLAMVLNQNQMQKIQNHFKKEWKFTATQEAPSVIMTEEDLIILAQTKNDLGLNNKQSRSISRNFSLKQLSVEEQLEETQNRFKNKFISNFVTNQAELELFKQNDEKNIQDY
jgi:hypothetical protein